jgi:lactate racemase
MQVTLAYGKTGTPLDIPASATVLEPRYAPDLSDPRAAIAAAIHNPIGCPPLRELARGKKSAAISVCDITRPAPNKLVLPEILKALEEGGIPCSAVRILIATGLHREATPAELDEILGAEILASCQVDSHRAKNLDEQAHLGQTRGGTPVYIDKRFVEADLHLTLGFIEPHLMAGFSGGRKLISIGLAGERTIKRLHSPLFMRDQAATEGSFPDNPLHRELIEIADMAGHDFMVDVALTRTRGVAAVFAGEPRTAHSQGVEFVRTSTVAAVDERADLVVTTSGGYPLDLTYYQAVKGVTAASHVVKPGGTILLVAECSEGLGGPEFAELVRSGRSWRELLDDLDGAPVTVDQWQAEKLALVARNVNLAFCLPGISAEDRACLWGPSYATPQEAFEDLRAKLPPGATTLVIPEGPYVFTQVQPEPALA